VEQTGCDPGAICEEVSDGTTGCFDSKLFARGTVFNCADETQAIAGARVVAMDINGSPASVVVTTDANGNYDLMVPTRRNPDGSPAGDDFTLRTDAEGFQTFPSGVRLALPIDTSAPTDEGGDFVIDNSLTDVCLVDLEPGFGTASIFGSVEVPEDSRGALVVAELDADSGFSAIADRDGGYRIFNLAAGTYSVKAYVQGENYDAESVTLTDGEEEETDLFLNDAPTSTLNGSTQIVNPGDGDATSVILVVESTFNESLVRGETPPGLRAPRPGISPNVNGAFTIEGIPDGIYVVLAAFENDFLVRDPDQCIAGTEILHQAFSGGTVDLSDGFKITGALNIVSPGASGPQNVATATPTFTWEDDSSEDNYLIKVVDSFGTVVGETSIPGASGGNPSIVYGNAGWLADGTATPLESGSFYQFRVTSTRTTGGAGSACEISQTEDLKGVFFVQ
jgi:hypothetical protein